MAFNPFHTFRKYSKTMFAVLAIICMLTFVLSSGLGGKSDFFTSFPEMLGGENKLPEIARINGKKIDARMIQETRERRKLANTYMTMFSIQAKFRVFDHAAARIKDAAPFISQGVDSILREMRQVAANPQFGPALYGMGAQMRGGQTSPEQAIQQHIFLLGVYIDSLNKDKKTDEADALIKVRELLERDLLRLSQPPQGSYFNGSIQNVEDVLDFMIWKQIAEKRDIKLNQETVMDLIKSEALGEDVKDLMAEVDKYMQSQYKDVRIPTILDALSDEFSVRIAQEALLGEGPRRDNVPAYVTPYEFRKFYDDQRRTVKVDLLPIKTDDYLAQVTQTPTDAELKELFEKHKKEEWSPQADHPGFKEPKRVKLEWISGKYDTPYWRKLGAETAKKSAAIVGAIGGGALAAKNPADPAGQLEIEYQKYKSLNRFPDWRYQIIFQPINAVHDSSVVRPEVYAATVASALATRGSGGAFFDPATTLASQALLQEMRQRVGFGLQNMALVGANPTAILGLNDSLVPQPLPLKVVEGQLSEKINANLARNQFNVEFTKLEDEIKKKAKDIKKPETKAEIQKLIAEFVKKHNLTQGASAELRDEFSLVNDPGLKPLKDYYYKDGQNATDKLGSRFAMQYFFDQQQRGMAPSGESPLYQPQWFQMMSPSFPASDDTTYFLTWKTDESDAKVPKKWEDVKDKVVAGWKRMKAQKLAADAVNALQKEARDKALRDRAALKQFAAEHKIEPIELDPLAKIVSHPSTRPGMPPVFFGPTIPADKVELASPEMTTAIIDMRDKPKGEAIVVNDQPKSHYYVAVLLDVQDPSEFEFKEVYSRPPAGSLFSDRSPSLQRYEMDRREKYRADLMAQLRTDAKLEIKTEEAKKLSDHGSGGEE